MKLLVIAGLLLAGAATHFGQNNQVLNASPDKVTLSANWETRNGGLIELRGHVQITASPMIVSADEADYDPLTGDLEPRGHVRVTFGKLTPTLKIENSTPEDLPALAPPQTLPPPK